MRRNSSVAFGVAVFLAVGVLYSPDARAASGINLYWDDCSPASGGAGVTNRAFDCATNAGANVIVGSFSPPADLSDLVGVFAVIDLITTDSPLPAWWNMQTDGCRVGVFAASFDFTGGPYACDDFWAGAAAGAMDYGIRSTLYGALDAARIRVVAAVKEGHPMPADGVEHYAFKITITNMNTVGAGACTGCSTPACIVFTSLLLSQPVDVGDYLLTTALSNTWITWQGSGANCLRVPVRNRTWGALKSLYRH